MPNISVPAPDAVWVSACASQTEICVEITPLANGDWALRDSKLGDKSPTLTFTADELRAFGHNVDQLIGSAEIMQ